MATSTNVGSTCSSSVNLHLCKAGSVLANVGLAGLCNNPGLILSKLRGGGRMSQRKKSLYILGRVINTFFLIGVAGGLIFILLAFVKSIFFYFERKV